MNIGYQHTVIDYYVDKLRKMREKREAFLGSIQSDAEASRHRDFVRKAIRDSFGPLPDKCPLETTITGTVQRKGYKIEKLYFQSRPGYIVTGNLYIPDNLDTKAPAVLGTCGHSWEGKGCSTYQEFAARLALNGFAVLIYDPVHQGERNQYHGLDYLGSGSGLCQAHNIFAKQLELAGENMPFWRVWDGIRALDCLLSRPEVDSSRVGITGNSGGGTLTEWIWANDDRLSFAAPSCHVTTFMKNLENELPTDAEQCPFSVLSNGLEMVDLMFAQAPKPVLLLGQKYDFFDCRGLKEAYGTLRHFYSNFGAEDNVNMFLGPTTHGYSAHLQREMVRHFRKFAGIEGEMVDITPETLPPQELNVLPTGNVVASGSKPIYTAISEIASELETKRTPPKGDAQWKDCISALLKLPENGSGKPPYHRVLGIQKHEDGYWGRYAVETENGIRSILHKRMTGIVEQAYNIDIPEKVTLHLPHYGTEADITSGMIPANEEGSPQLYALDTRGIGESQPGGAIEDFDNQYGMDYMMHSFALMFGESYIGGRIFDILRTIELLKSGGAREISLSGRGQGAILAALTAALLPEIKKVVLSDAPDSFRSWIDDRICNWPSSNIIVGVLKHFDLPELYAHLGNRLEIKSRMNAYMQEQQ